MTEAILTFTTRKGEAYLTTTFHIGARNRNAIRAQINGLHKSIKDGAMPLVKGSNPSITWTKE